MSYFLKRNIFPMWKTGSYLEKKYTFLISYILWNSARETIFTLHKYLFAKRKGTRLTYNSTFFYLISVWEEEAIFFWLLKPTSFSKILYSASCVISLYKLPLTLLHLQFAVDIPKCLNSQISWKSGIHTLSLCAQFSFIPYN